jgi:hypothetical protein
MFPLPYTNMLVSNAAATAATVAKKQALLAEKKPSTWDQVGGFLGQVLAGYQTASAPPATTTPTPLAPTYPSSGSSSSSLLSPPVVIAGAALLAFLVLRRR